MPLDPTDLILSDPKIKTDAASSPPRTTTESLEGVESLEKLGEGLQKRFSTVGSASLIFASPACLWLSLWRPLYTESFVTCIHASLIAFDDG